MPGTSPGMTERVVVRTGCAARSVTHKKSEPAPGRGPALKDLILGTGVGRDQVQVRVFPSSDGRQRAR
jgi:hypothetical protein